MATGASSDFEAATRKAREMVQHYGMSALIGPMHVGKNPSPEVRRQVDSEVSRILTESYARVTSLLVRLPHSSHGVARDHNKKAEFLGVGMFPGGSVVRTCQAESCPILVRGSSALFGSKAIVSHIMLQCRCSWMPAEITGGWYPCGQGVMSVGWAQTERQGQLQTVADALIQHETLNRSELQQLLAGTSGRPPDDPATAELFTDS